MVEDDVLAEANKDFKEFESAFGFKCYEALKIQMSRLYEKINELQKSRDNWKNKYLKLKNETKN